MDLEKLAARARATLLTVSFVGILVMLMGVLLTVTIIVHTMNQHDVAGPSRDWVDGLTLAGGPLTLAAVGFLIACMPWAARMLVTFIYHRANDSRYRTDQLLGNLESQRQLLEGIKDTASLSDAAKQIAYRAKDLDILRAAIREDMDKGDFEAATMLANEMERRFGYADEAEKLRSQINETSRAAIDARVNDTIDNVDLLLHKQAWDDAVREASRLEKQFPTHPEARKLKARVASAKEAHKRELLKDWKDTLARGDVDASVALVRQLDQYLTPEEAEAHKESAREVFRKRQQQLQTQLELHVRDKNAAATYRVAKQIIDEFPNTRMAAELREKLPILQKNAEQSMATSS